MELAQILAEPGQRQLAVAGVAAVFGAVEVFWEVYNLARLDDIVYKMKAKIYPSVRKDYNKDLEKIKKRAKLFEKVSWGLPTAIGLGEAIKNSSPVVGSYLLEGVVDVASGIGGYLVGRMGFVWAMKGLVAIADGDYNLFHKKNNEE